MQGNIFKPRISPEGHGLWNQLVYEIHLPAEENCININ